MNTVVKAAAIAALMAPSVALAGSYDKPMEDESPMVMVEEAAGSSAGSSAGSLGSMGGGAALAVGALAVLAVAAASGT